MLSRHRQQMPGKVELLLLLLLHVGVGIGKLCLVHGLRVQLSLGLGLSLVYIQCLLSGGGVVNTIDIGLRRGGSHHGLKVLHLLKSLEILHLLLVHVGIGLLHHLGLAIEVQALKLLSGDLKSPQLLLKPLLLLRQVGISVIS